MSEEYSEEKETDHLTHSANLKHTRYGWLRLTPAYSVHLVDQVISESLLMQDTHVVLDPFCGTGTTALVCGERGITADTTDIRDAKRFNHPANSLG